MSPVTILICSWDYNWHDNFSYVYEVHKLPRFASREGVFSSDIFSALNNWENNIEKLLTITQKFIIKDIITIMISLGLQWKNSVEESHDLQSVNPPSDLDKAPIEEQAIMHISIPNREKS